MHQSNYYWLVVLWSNLNYSRPDLNFGSMQVSSFVGVSIGECAPKVDFPWTDRLPATLKRAVTRSSRTAANSYSLQSSCCPRLDCLGGSPCNRYSAVSPLAHPARLSCVWCGRPCCGFCSSRSCRGAIRTRDTQIRPDHHLRPPCICTGVGEP